MEKQGFNTGEFSIALFHEFTSIKNIVFQPSSIFYGVLFEKVSFEHLRSNRKRSDRTYSLQRETNDVDEIAFQDQ